MYFRLESEEEEKFKEWKKEHDRQCPFASRENQGAIGGRFTYSFTPNNIGLTIKIGCACGANVDVTDYASW